VSFSVTVVVTFSRQSQRSRRHGHNIISLQPTMRMSGSEMMPLRPSLPTFRGRLGFILCLLSLMLSWNGIVAVEDEEASPDHNVSLDYEFPIENGLVVLQDLDEVEQALSQQRLDEPESAVMFLLIYSPSCPHSQALVKRTEEAYRLLQNYLAETKSDAEFPLLGKLDGSCEEESRWEALGISHYPTLAFLAGDGEDNTFLLQCIGNLDTPESVMRTVLHYYHRYVSGPAKYKGGLIDIRSKEFANMKELQNFVTQHRKALVEYSVVELTFPPPMAPEEKEYIQWLVEEDDQPDDFTLVVQCANPEASFTQHQALMEDFDDMAFVVSKRRDCLFVKVSDCSSMGESAVVAWKIPLDFDFDDWNRLSTFDFVASNDPHQQLISFIINVCTPSVLWFDRRSTAPIAFPKHRKVHAVLFVDLHNISAGTQDPAAIEQRNVLRHFRRTCRNHRRSIRDVVVQDMVCLIIPSTETRVMTTFGIDIWTPLDESVFDPKHVDTQVLPILLITDQRYGGTRRYYLNRKDLLASNEAISGFVSSFWHGRLQPEVKSSNTKTRVLDSGVRVVSSESLRRELQEENKGKHALIFFTAPTCGHCKRFSILFNQLASILEHVNWDAFLTLYRMDVTTNEVLDFNMTVRWVPDLYYMSPNDRGHPVRFDLADNLGDEAGRLNTPMQIVQWLLHVGDFETKQLRHLLSELKENF